MKIRTFHRTCAITFSPLFLLSSIGGSCLLFRTAGFYEKEIKELAVSFHTWEVIPVPYIGLILALGLFAVTVSGIILFFNKRA